MHKKKIGITQLAVTFIILGIAIVVDRVTGSDWFGRVLDFWPLLLVWIGAEIVWWQSRSRTQEEGGWKLDAKSLVLLFLVLSVSGVFHTVNNAMASAGRSGLWGMFGNWNFGPSHTVLLKDEDLALTGAESLYIDNSVGKITVEGTESDTIHLKAEAKVNSTDSAAAQERAKNIAIRVTDGKEARIVVEDSGSRNNPPSVNLTLQVPKKLAISNKTNAGEIEVTGVANANLQSDAGKIQADRIAGTLQVRTHAGEIQADEVGSIDLQTDMGRIKVQNVKEKVKATTNAGEIDIKTQYAVAGDWDLRTDMGKISASIPKDSSVKIQAAADMGAIKGLQNSSKGPSSTGSEERNGGKFLIHANTDAGAIEFDIH